MQFTALETLVEELYKDMGSTPLTPRSVARHFGISLIYHQDESMIVQYDGYVKIALNLEESDHRQWQQFAHELGHALRHDCGQHHMVKTFRQLQESQARNFAYHFCIPTHILIDWQPAVYRDETIQKLAKEFSVTVPFARRRWDMWEQRCFDHEFMQTEYDRFAAQSNAPLSEPTAIQPITQAEVDSDPDNYHLIDVYGQMFYITNEEMKAYQYILDLEIKPELTVNPYEMETEFRAFLQEFTKDDYEVIFSMFGD